MTPCCGNEDKQPELEGVIQRMSVLPGNPLVVIQCRLGSTRLPRKALALIGEKTLIEHVWQRANAIDGIADVVIAVPDHWTRTELIGIGLPSAKVIAFPQFDENDVLSRYAWIARQWESHGVLCRVTADCPLLAPESCAAVLDEIAGDYSGGGSLNTYRTNVWDGYIDGTDFEAFGRGLLLDSDAEVTDAKDREHVTPWMRVVPYATPGEPKISVDDPADLERVRAIYDHLEDKSDYSLAATLRAAELAGV